MGHSLGALISLLVTVIYPATKTMKIVEKELLLPNPKDAVCMPPIPLPHIMHMRSIFLSQWWKFYGRSLNDNRGWDMLSLSKYVLNPNSDVTNLTYVFDLIYVSRDLDIQNMAVDMTNRHHMRENDNRGWDMLLLSKYVLNPNSDVTNLTYVFDLIYVSRDLDIQNMAVDMTNRHHMRENGRSFNSVYEVTKSEVFSRFYCILFYVHVLHTIITYSEDIVR